MKRTIYVGGLDEQALGLPTNLGGCAENYGMPLRIFKRDIGGIYRMLFKIFQGDIGVV